MGFDWYQRSGVDPWQLGLCDEHGAALAELGFRRGLLPQYAAQLKTADRCAVCSGTTSITEIRACRCNMLGTPCPVHRQAASGAAGEWTRVRCVKCQAELQVPSERVAFENGDDGIIAVDITGWARRNGAGDELLCPFHGGGMSYHLEYVDGPRGELADDEDLDDIDSAGGDDV